MISAHYKTVSNGDLEFNSDVEEAPPKLGGTFGEDEVSVSKTDENRLNSTPNAGSSNLERLHEMIEASEANQTSTVLSWALSGAGFIVHNRSMFLDQCLRHYFPQVSKVESFYRSLNRWGIRKIRKGPYKGVWRHKDGSFFRGSHGAVKGDFQPEMIPGAFVAMEMEVKKSESTLKCVAGESAASPSSKKPWGLDCDSSVESSSAVSSDMTLEEEEAIDRDLAEFFAVLADSITDEMVTMDPDEIMLVRSSGATILVPKKSLKNDSSKHCNTQLQNQSCISPVGNFPIQNFDPNFRHFYPV